MSEKKGKDLPPRNPVASCRGSQSKTTKHVAGKIQVYDAFPRDCKFAFMTPGYYVTGFRIFDVYKTEPDFSESRKFHFLEDPKQANKWELLKKRIPFPKGRVLDLPGSREVHYKHYCLRSLTPESAMSWRKSIKQDISMAKNLDYTEEKEPATECICEE